MKIRLITVGQKMPDWVTKGYLEYANRLPVDCKLDLCEVPLIKRAKGANISKLQAREGSRMLESIGRNDYVIAMDVTGKSWSTENLAEKLHRWRLSGRDVSLMVGGPEGLDPMVSASAQEKWSLSALTLPHPLVRVMLAEQIYRAWTILVHHPYHK